MHRKGEDLSSSSHKSRGWFVAAGAVLLLASAACHRRAERQVSYVESLRCGMTRAEVTRLAHEHGYNSSDPGWLARSSTSAKKELTLLDLTFRSGRLVAYREGTYGPRTKRVVYRTVDLCASR